MEIIYHKGDIFWRNLVQALGRDASADAVSVRQIDEKEFDKYDIHVGFPIELDNRTEIPNPNHPDLQKS